MKRILIVSLVIFFLAGLYVATAKTRVCQPVGMSDVEAARIIAIATEHGESFRHVIDAARENDISLKNDTTLADILADAAQALELAKERYERRGMSDRSVGYRLDEGMSLDDALRETNYSQIHSLNTNYFAISLGDHLRKLAVDIGGKPAVLAYHFDIDGEAFIFALSQFAKSADLKYLEARRSSLFDTISIRYRFFESWTAFRADAFAKVLINITQNQTNGELTITYVSLLPYEFKNGFAPSDWIGSHKCLVKFIDEE